MAEETRIETLLAEAGKKFEEDGQAIASLGRSIIFLPRGCEPGKSYRVKLEELRADARGRMMFRGIPAPDLISEKWQADGDDLVKNQFATDWLGEKKMVAEVQRRKAQERFGGSYHRYDSRVNWGLDWKSTKVEKYSPKYTPIERESVEAGQLVWKRISEIAGEEFDSEQFSVENWKVVSSIWQINRLQPHWIPEWEIIVEMEYKEASSYRASSHKHKTTWVELPGWVQAELEEKYPLCLCGRERVDLEQAKGFPQCEQCRKDAVCQRCGQPGQGKIVQVGIKSTCQNCQAYEAGEQLIDRSLSPDQRQKIAQEATNLLAGQALNKEEGEAILRNTLDHITSSWTKDDLLRKWSGYGWYYFCDQGIFGSKLAPAALQILQFLPQASGNGLVEMVGWLTGDSKPRPRDDRDFYLRTQVKGEDGVKPEITENLLKQVKVADFLRGSESDRLAALEAQKRVSSFGKQDTRVWLIADEIEKILQSSEQDFRLACQKAAEAEEWIVGVEQLKKLLDTEYNSCPVCGCEWTPQEGVACCYLDENLYDTLPLAIEESRSADGRLLVQVYADMRHARVTLVVEDPRVPEQGVKTKMLWNPPGEEKLEKIFQLRGLESRLGNIERELRDCEGDYPSRVKLIFQQDPERGTLFAIANVQDLSVLNNRTQEYDTVSGSVRFVCDPNRCGWLETPPASGETWVSTWGRMIGRDNKGRPIIIANPQQKIDPAIEAEIQKIKAEIAMTTSDQARETDPDQTNSLEDLKKKFQR